MFRNDAHKTTGVHEIRADALVASLPAPGTAALVLPVRVGLLVLRRRRAPR